MNTQQVMVAQTMLFLIVKLLKFGFKWSGRPVVAVVASLSLLLCGGYTIEKAIFNMDAIVDMLTNFATIALGALGIANLTEYKDREALIAYVRQQMQSEILSKLSPRERKKVLGETTTINDPVEAFHQRPADERTLKIDRDPLKPTGKRNLPPGPYDLDPRQAEKL